MDNMLPLETSVLPVQGSIRLGVNEQKVKDLWQSDGKCGLLFFPYHSIDFKKILHFTKIKGPEIEWLKKIVLATSRPSHIRYLSWVINSQCENIFYKSSFREIADGFIQKYMPHGNYLALHWRYDKKDWYVHCQRDHDVKNMREDNPCRLVKK